MTRCYRENINLKSSVYNQTGQSYVDQVSLHRSMCTHLRRVLLAKSAVDSRNPRYARRSMRKRCGPPASNKLRFLGECPSDETIDKLAYDTEHHPCDIIRVRCRNKSSSKDRSPRTEGVRAINDENCPCLRPLTTGERSRIAKSSLKVRKIPENFRPRAGVDVDADDEENQRSCKSKCKSPPCCGGLSRRHPRGDLHRDEAPPPRCCRQRSSSNERCDCPSSIGDAGRTTAPPERGNREEEARYAKFVYDITQDIVRNGLYTDRELREVFERHVERNSARLNKRKMLYEIYQLKISLNMMDESEEEDEVEADLVFAEKFAVFRVPKPPTPPKILNENKVIEKLESFRHHQETGGETSVVSSPGRKGVVFVDPNPEFLVTELDVLSTLMDNNVEPQQIQRIYKNLYQRSKDMSLCEAVQVGSEVAYSHRLKRVDRCCSPLSLRGASAAIGAGGIRSRGILRKDAGYFAREPASSPGKRRQDAERHAKARESEALAKCEKWKLTGCACDERPCEKHGERAEKQRDKSPDKVGPTTADNKSGIMKEGPAKIGNEQQKKDADKAASKMKPQKSRKSSSEDRNKVTESPSKIDDTNQGLPGTCESKSASSQDDPPESVPSENNDEEIEEDIESMIDELPEKSPRKSSDTEKGDKSDDEVKESESLREDNEKEAESDTEASVKYSDDLSDMSDTSTDTNDSSKQSGPRKKTVKYSSVKDYFEKFATLEDQKIWRISEGSSDSTSSSVLSIGAASLLHRHQPHDGPHAGRGPATTTTTTTTTTRPPERASTGSADGGAQEAGAEPAGCIRPAVKKQRTSSGTSAFKRLSDAWNGRISELSSDFYGSSFHRPRYCEPSCREAAAPGAPPRRDSRGLNNCSDYCKFVRTNCRNLSKPTSCLNKAKDKLDSDESSDSS